MRASCAMLCGLAVFCLLVPIVAQGEDTYPAVPAPSNSAATAPDPLLQLLVNKGVLNAEEAKSLSGTPEQQRARLLELLRQKGVLSAADYDSLTTPSASAQVAPNLIASTTPILPAALATSTAPEPKPAAPAGPAVIPAVAPLRVLPIDVPKQGGMIPDLKLGSGASIKVYGFYKASAVSDTASSGGPTFGSQDWPLPLLLGDTGPTSDPQVHIKARQFRIGAQTEWVPKGSSFTVTGRVEGDFEGDYTDVNNRNISGSARSQFSLRLAWMRIDHKIGDTPWFAQFGMDWSLLGSSTLPSLFETTGLGVGMGSLYERMPSFKTGLQFHSGDFKVQPEFAIVMSTAGSAALSVDQRLRFGDRAGAESNQPGLEARVVFQFPLSHNWKGVAPAQIIFSGHHARMNEIIPHATQTVTIPTSVTIPATCAVLPCTITIPAPTVFTNVTSQNVGFTPYTIQNASNCPATGTCNLASIFPHGVQVGNPQNIYTAEVQLPTPWVTFVGKVYRGNDLRFFFGGQLNDVFSNLVTPGLVDPSSLLTGISESGRSILFGCAGATSVGTSTAPAVNCAGNPVMSATLTPVGGVGGFAELSFPLSRIFHANPDGPNSGWILHVSYGTDRAKYSDSGAVGGFARGNRLGRTDLDTASLTYRLNKWVTFVHEASYITTFTANARSAAGVISPQFLLFAGKDVRQAHNWRNEFGPVFTF